MIDRETVELIKERASIVDVVGKYVHLIKSGANYKGLCPFHNERTPSFSVNVRKNYCYCFSCRKGGNPVNFLMEKEGLSFQDAMRELAKMYGIEIPERDMTDEQRERLNRRDLLLGINNWAMERMESNLRSTEEGEAVALQYLYHRHVTDEAVRAFHIGYVTENSREFVEAIEKKGYDPEALMELGLVGKSERDGRYYDKMRGRVIFPILSEGGRVVGFGARTMKKEDKAKYVNSPANSIYNKKEVLYGFVQGKSAIRDKKKAYLVEGYMDVIGFWQAGIRNVVAACGTAFTEEQASLLMRHADNITLLFDSDGAGRRAAEKSIRTLLRIGLSPKVLILPEGHDPDSFARENSPEEVEKYIGENEIDFLSYLVRTYLDGRGDDPVALENGMREVVGVLAFIESGLTREIYVRELAKQTGFPEDILGQAAAEARRAVEREISLERSFRENERLREKENVRNGVGISVESATPNGIAGPSDNPSRPSSPSSLSSPSEATPSGAVSQPNLHLESLRPERNLFLREKVICDYLVKYGLLVAGTVEDGEGNRYEVTVWEYVKSQIENDGTSFSTPVFTRLYDRVMEVISQFQPHWDTYSDALERKIETMRQEGYEAIASKNLDMGAIAAEESRLEESLVAQRESLRREYERGYIESALSYDEDAEIRALVADFIIEKHQLSNIYLKNGNVEKDEDRLAVIVPRAICEWKSELLTLRHKKLMERFATTDPADEDTIRDIQAELASILDMRSEIAKNIGDRIIAPRR